ncbi:MAG: winged helix-turn-helix domain-containing protein [Candidatus Omnitrophica bacterium]|nr:winged helix-turn-helix domain-containing protein [Candidatus Omnitrophota bacterium]
MITEIGITAGDIWHYLDEKHDATLDELVRHTAQNRERVLMSLGWLAREGHVNLREDNGVYRANLTSHSH